MVENLRLNTYPSTLWRGQAACLTASALLPWPQEPDVHVVQMRKLRVTRSFNLQSRSIFGKLGIKFVDSTSPYALIKDMYYGFFFLVSQAICVTRQIQIQCQYTFHFSSYHKTSLPIRIQSTQKKSNNLCTVARFWYHVRFLYLKSYDCRALFSKEIYKLNWIFGQKSKYRSRAIITRCLYTYCPIF